MRQHEPESELQELGESGGDETGDVTLRRLGLAEQEVVLHPLLEELILAALGGTPRCRGA